MLGSLLAASLITVGCSKDETGTVVDPGVTGGAKRLVLQDTIKTNRTLSADTVYELKGKVKVAPGAVLTVPPGTRIEGEAGSFLIMQRGTATLPSARLEAVGTPEKPIVFTSIAPAGAKSTGQWGGLVFCGLASNNQPNGSAAIEGDENPDLYGWGGVLSGPKDDDNSGTLKYVVVEFGGFEIKPGSEINGVTFYAVGSGTTIDYVQSHYNNDDGFEMFGGTVNLKHCISSGNSDDSFDWDNGWHGKGQYLLAVQRTGFGKFARGNEVDNNADGTNATPITHSTMVNVTMIGSGSTSDKQGTDGDPNDGCYFRRGAQGSCYNYLVYNFGGAGFVMDVEKGNPKVDANASSGSLFIKNSLLSNKRGNLANGKGEILLTTKSNGVYSDPTAELAGVVSSWNNKTAAPGSAANALDPLFTNFTVADNNAVPDFTLKAGSPALSFDSPVTDYPTDSFFDQAGRSFMGAFPAATTAGADWTKGWAHWNTR
jgi:hypothetical protein